MLPETSIGAVVAATVTGVISLIGLIISKENKTSEFRQVWIDELRKDLALVISNAHQLEGYRAIANGDTAKIWEDVREYFTEINAAISRIKLRINPLESENMRLLSSLEKMENFIPAHPKDRGTIQISEIENEIISNSQLVLKKEWRRVKEGEITYRVSKYLAVFISIVGALFLWWA